MGRPIRDNDILSRFIKPAARGGRRAVGELAVSAHFALRLAEAGRRRHEGCARTDAAFASLYDDGHLHAVRSRVILPVFWRQISTKFFGMMVARDGVEPPTPAFSGLRSTT
jgi:hypothetical protein